MRERGDTPAVPDASQPADIISDRTGVITILRVFRGEGQVEVGSMAREGDLLVSGLVHLRLDEKTMLAHSTADIYARVWHQSTAATPVNGYAKVPTGKKKCAICAEFGKIPDKFLQRR